MTLDPTVVYEAVRAWRAAQPHARNRMGRNQRTKEHFAGESADAVLARHGITWADRATYLAYERKIRRIAL